MKSKYMKLLFLILILSPVTVNDCHSLESKKIKSYNLRNPIEYSFSSTKERLLDKLKSIYDKNFDEDKACWGIYEHPRDGILLSTWPHYSIYHLPLFKKNGEIGKIVCMFKITLSELGTNQTLVKVTPIPGWYHMFTDLVSGMPFSRDSHLKSKELPTSTFFEYTFLLKLGELLGEKGMPPINTDITKAKEVVT